jgi:hypothetical protein
MVRNIVVSVIIGILCVAILGGCSKKTDQPPVEQQQAKTATEYKAEADQQITEQNANEELDKLEKDVNADANAVDANET